jgi:hypothetical protein
MKKLVLAVTIFYVFSTYVTAMSIDEKIDNYSLNRLIGNDVKDTQDVIRNSLAEANKSSFKAKEAYFKARVKDTQSYKVYVTKADALKTYDIEASKARDEAYKALSKRDKALCHRSGLDESSSKTNNSVLKDREEIIYSEFDTADANAAKTYAILCETGTKIIKSDSNEAVKLYNEAAKFYDEAARAYKEIVVAFSSVNAAIIRIAEKVKGSDGYAKYEARVAEKRKTAEAWAKYQTYAKKLKKVSEAYARVATIRIELCKSAETYAKAAKSYAKATKTYAKVAKSSIALPEADRLCCFKFEDAVALHKAHKISDAQLASVPSSKASYNTVDAYSAYCRINLKLIEAIVAACYEEDEAAKLRTELSKSSLEQAQDIVQRQAESISRY